MAAGVDADGGVIPLVVGIDPGMTTGGIVAVSAAGVLAAESIGAKGSATVETGDPVFGEAVLKAERVVRKTIRVLAEWESRWGRPDALVVESFIDLPSRSRHRDEDVAPVWIKDRWKTPLVIGLLHAYLAPYSPVYQNPAILSGYRDELVRLRSGTAEFPGAELLRNDHTRTAWCHADHGFERYVSEHGRA